MPFNKLYAWVLFSVALLSCSIGTFSYLAIGSKVTDVIFYYYNGYDLLFFLEIQYAVVANAYPGHILELSFELKPDF